jgi:hypothetical protein
MNASSPLNENVGWLNNLHKKNNKENKKYTTFPTVRKQH